MRICLLDFRFSKISQSYYSLPTQHRRRALFAVFRQLVKSNPEAFGDDRHKHVYDLGNTFYSVGCTITQEHGDCIFKIPAVRELHFAFVKCCVCFMIYYFLGGNQERVQQEIFIQRWFERASDYCTVDWRGEVVS